MKINNIKNKSCLISVLENLKKKNFEIKKIFFLKTKKNFIKRYKSQRKCTQNFMSLNGEIELVIKKKKIKKIKLKEFKNFVNVPPLNWVKIKLKKNQILMVLCNENYSEKDYIRNYNKFLKIVN